MLAMLKLIKPIPLLVQFMFMCQYVQTFISTHSRQSQYLQTTEKQKKAHTRIQGQIRR